MQVVVTGGAGFIGANLCCRLLDDGHDVRVIDNFSSGYRSNLAGLDLEVREADIRDRSAMEAAIRGSDAVVHLAARPSVPLSIDDPKLTNDINVNGTLSVLLAARDNDAYFIFASSSAVYGTNKVLPKHEEMRPEPLSPYAASKLAGESYLLSFQSVYGMSGLAFRFFNVYGPLQAPRHAYAAVVPAFASALLQGRPLVVHGDGTQTRDFTSAAAVASVLADAVARRVAHHHAVNLAFGTRTSLLELIPMLEKIAGCKAQVVHAPPRPGDVHESQADNSTLCRLFPNAMSDELSTGLAATIHWLRDAASEQR